MKRVQHEIDQRMQHFEDVLRQEGVKLTHQRTEIFREVAEADDHPDADQIFQRVKQRLPSISLDTVYRTLWLLNDLGLVVTMSINGRRTRFDANLSRHHHFVCSRCGFTRDFFSNDLDNIMLPRALDTLGIIEGTHVEVRGVCHECAAEK